MKLFTTDQVKKFFNILQKMDRGFPIGISKYTGYDKLNPHLTPCEKEIFVKRSIHKWLKGKYLIFYKTDKETDREFKQYISITNIRYSLGWGDDLDVRIYDYAQPMNIWTEMKISHNDALRLEGEWSDDVIHKNLLNLFTLTIPEKEYVFKAYDLSKTKTSKKKIKSYKETETTISFMARTEKEAYKKKREHEKAAIDDKILISSDIIEIK